MATRQPTNDHDEHPFDGIDFVLLLATAVVPWLLPLTVAQYFARHQAGWQPGHVVEALRATPERTRALLDTAQRLTIRRGGAEGVSHPAPLAGADDRLLLTLDEAPHALVIGHTRGGKTTLMHELATRRARSGARVVVCDPDAAPGQWPGCSVFGAGDNYTHIREGLQILGGEVQRRRKLRAEGEREFESLCLVADEVQDIFAEVDGARELVETIARRGAKLNIHALLGVQDKQVKTLGLEGKGALRNNFLVADVYHDKATGQRIARLEQAGEAVRTLQIPELPDPTALIVRKPTSATRASAAAAPARRVAVHSAVVTGGSDTALLAGLLAAPTERETSQALPHETASPSLPERFPAASEGERGEIPATNALPVAAQVAAAQETPGVHVVFAATNALPVATSLTLVLPREGEIDRDGKIKALVALGVSATKIREIVGGKTAEVLAKVRQAKAELGFAVEGDQGDDTPAESRE
jgi:hypothetical protein